VFLTADKSNWWACYGFWAFKLRGHAKCLLMDGGRTRWELDRRAFVRDPEPQYPRTKYKATEQEPVDPRVPRRSAAAPAGGAAVDRRPLARRIHGRNAAHARLSAGRGAASRTHPRGEKRSLVPRAVNDDGTIKSREDLEKIYLDGAGLKKPGRPGHRVTAGFGERSSHTWFVLQYLLGYGKVKKLRTGSWTEWGKPRRRADREGGLRNFSDDLKKIVLRQE